MAAGIPVSYQENGWLKHFFRILGVVALMGGGALAALVPDGGLPGMIIGGIAIVLLVVSELHFARQKAAERSVIDTGSGFRWLGGPLEIDVRDSQVIAVRMRRTSKFSAGILKGVVRRFEVWIAGAPGGAPSTLGRGRDKPMCMTNRLALGGADPLAALMTRVIEDLKQRTAAGLAEGAVLEGDGWILAAMQLSIARGRTVETLPFAEIDKAAVFDGKICFWRRGQDEPAARISPDSKNASVLFSLLSEWIEHQREGSNGQPAATPGASGMGRLLFERRGTEVVWQVVWLLGFPLALIGGVAGWTLLARRGMLLPLGVFFLVGAAMGLLLGALYGRYRLRCYELGLIRRRGRDEFRLRYEDITEFTYSATPMFYKGAYTGTQLSLTFRAARAAIRYSAKVQNLDADLEYLRDHIAEIIAHRMLGELQVGRTVPWMGDVVFLPQGLSFRRAKMLGLASGPVEVLPYEQIRGVNLNEGLFCLYSKAEARPVINKPVSSANFFPGYMVVLALLDIARKGGEGATVEGTMVEE